MTCAPHKESNWVGITFPSQIRYSEGARAAHREVVAIRRVLTVASSGEKGVGDVGFDVFPGEILAFIGPSGCGRTTALRDLSRMPDDMPHCRVERTIAFELLHL